MKWVLILILMLALASCGDDMTGDHPTDQTPIAKVKSLVIGWDCPSRDSAGNIAYFDEFYSRPFANRFDGSDSGRATVIFLEDEGIAHTCFTDDSSRIALELPYGLYRVIVESTYSTPDTLFNVMISRDTTLVLDYTCRDSRFLPH